MAGLAYGSALLQRTAVESFWNGYYEIPDPFADLFYTRTSTQLTDTYARLGAAPMPQQWSGDKVVKDVNEYSFTAKNVPYEATVSVDKELIKFQQWDEIAGLVRNLGNKARQHRIKLATTLIEAGLSTVCEDGQFFFDDDHRHTNAEYTTNQDNDLATTVAATATPTDLEFATSVRGIRQTFYTFKDDRGDPAVPVGSLDASNFVIMVAPGYMSVAERVATADSLTGPLGNDLRGKFEVRVNPFMTAVGTTPAIYGFIHGSAAPNGRRPIIVQEAGALELSDTMGGDEHFRNGGVAYSATWWGGTFYGEWRTAILDTLTV